MKLKNDTSQIRTTRRKPIIHEEGQDYLQKQFTALHLVHIPRIPHNNKVKKFV